MSIQRIKNIVAYLLLGVVICSNTDVAGAGFSIREYAQRFFKANEQLIKATDGRAQIMWSLDRRNSFRITPALKVTAFKLDDTTDSAFHPYQLSNFTSELNKNPGIPQDQKARYKTLVEHELKMLENCIPTSDTEWDFLSTFLNSMHTTSENIPTYLPFICTLYKTIHQVEAAIKEQTLRKALLFLPDRLWLEKKLTQAIDDELKKSWQDLHTALGRPTPSDANAEKELLPLCYKALMIASPVYNNIKLTRFRCTATLWIASFAFISPDKLIESNILSNIMVNGGILALGILDQRSPSSLYRLPDVLVLALCAGLGAFWGHAARDTYRDRFLALFKRAVRIPVKQR